MICTRCRTLTRIDDEHHSSAGIEPIEDLLFDLREGVARRDDLDRQLRCLGPEAFCLSDRFDTVAANECYIRRTHGIGIAGEPETGLGGVCGAELVLLDIPCQAPGEAHSHGPCTFPAGFVRRKSPHTSS